ncbi:MAG: hypothetical protein M0P21_00465 [Methanoculleus sp.]|nr:hypothetical protein [Methanoculleus sp.]
MGTLHPACRSVLYNHRNPATGRNTDGDPDIGNNTPTYHNGNPDSRPAADIRANRVTDTVTKTRACDDNTPV